VLEEHSVIGEPVDCSGVIGAEAFEKLELPSSLKLGTISNLTLVSPSNLEINFSPQSALAYVVDRAAFDRVIADKTRQSGVTFHLGTRVVDLDVQQEYVEATVISNSSTVNRQPSKRPEAGKLGSWQAGGPISHSPFAIRTETLRSKMAILAGGPRYNLQRKLGMGEPCDFLKTAQVELPIKGIQQAKISLGSRVAPGSFSWIAPFRRGNSDFARIGVSAKEAAGGFLQSRLRQLNREGLQKKGYAI